MKHTILTVQLFFYGIIVIVLGFVAKKQFTDLEGFSYLVGGLKLGGALMICGAFSLQYPWHGYLAGGVVALLGFCYNAAKLPQLASSLTSVGGQSPALPLIEGAITAICAIILLHTIRIIIKEKMRRMMDEKEN